MQWCFLRSQAGIVENEVTEKGHFENDSSSLFESLVRETLQNSLDARINDATTVRVTFKSSDAKQTKFVEQLFDGWKEHAKAPINPEEPDVPIIDVDDLDFRNPSALVIEDFGTTGLTGSTAGADKGNFDSFWRKHGKGNKRKSENGRHGLGKLVFSSASKASVFFGVTRRLNDDGTYLMGQTVLQNHKIGDKTYPPHTLFGSWDNSNADEMERKPIPCEDSSFIKKFVRCFKLGRGNKSGLSVVIPFPSDFDMESMIKAGIENYFYSLAKGDLELVFNDIEINKRNFRQHAKKYAPDFVQDYAAFFDFLDDVIEAEESSKPIRLDSDWVNDKTLNSEDFPSEILEKSRDQFSSGELIHVYLPVTVTKKRQKPSRTGVDVYIKKPEDLIQGKDVHLRSSLSLPALAKFKQKKIPAFFIMTAKETDVCEFIGDAENKAHTGLNARADKLREKYKRGTYQDSILAIKGCSTQLYRALAELSGKDDETALLKYFYNREGAAKTRKNTENKSIPETLNIPRSTNLLQIDDRKGAGFTIKNSKDLTAEQLPQTFLIKMAYKNGKSSSFNQHSEHDFQIRSVITKRGLKESNKGNVIITKDKRLAASPPDINPRYDSKGQVKTNEFEMKVTDIPFQITLKGFCEYRQLDVHAQIGEQR